MIPGFIQGSGKAQENYPISKLGTRIVMYYSTNIYYIGIDFHANLFTPLRKLHNLSLMCSLKLYAFC